MDEAPPPLPPPAIEQPAPHQVSYGLVTGRAARGTRRVVVSANGRVLVAKPLRRRRFSLRVELPAGEATVRVTTHGAGNRRSASVVRDVYALPAAAAARPRVVRAREDRYLGLRLRRLVRGYRGTAACYVESLTSGRGAAWNAKARFPAASTLKLAIAAAVLAEHDGIPAPRSYVGGQLREMIIPSDDAAANALEVWLAGSTSAGSHQVNQLMASIGMTDSIMYGGYETSDAKRGGAAAKRPPSGIVARHGVRPIRIRARGFGSWADTESALADSGLAQGDGRIPVQVDDAPPFGVGKYTTAVDMAALHRAIWLASANRGPLRREQPGFTAADARHLLWLLAHVRDTPKLDRAVRGEHDVHVLHKAGWISSGRHDTGLVFWRGGVFVASVMTWSSSGAGPSSDVLAGRVAALSLQRFRRLSR